jgi:UDP-glucose 4-epimerase
MSKKVLIIGSCGYTGSVLFEYLQKNTDYELYSVDIEWYGKNVNTENHNKLYYFYLTEEYLSQFDSIVLLAAHSSVKSVDDDYLGSFWNNVINFVYLLPKLKPEQKFIFASSASLYSGLDGDYLTEDNPRYTALNYYDLQKHYIEKQVSLSSVQYYALRMGTVCGYSPIIRIDTAFNAFTNSYKTKGSIDVFNPMAKRGFLSTHDFCRGVRVIIENGSYEKRGIYNLASFNMSIGQLAQKLGKLFNCPVNYGADTSKYYNFTLNVAKMGINFDFIPESTVESTLQLLLDNWDSMIKGDRNKAAGHSEPLIVV